jgi:hypothetical protein
MWGGSGTPDAAVKDSNKKRAKTKIFFTISPPENLSESATAGPDADFLIYFLVFSLSRGNHFPDL